VLHEGSRLIIVQAYRKLKNNYVKEQKFFIYNKKRNSEIIDFVLHEGDRLIIVQVAEIVNPKIKDVNGGTEHVNKEDFICKKLF
jgi:hypothetical protein